MPIYKVNGVKKDGLQKYKVRVNFVSDSGESKQLTRVAFGREEAEDLERRLTSEVKSKGEGAVKRITLSRLLEECLKARRFEVRETSLDKWRRDFGYYILPSFADTRVDKLSVSMLLDWKLSMEQTGLGYRTKKSAYGSLRVVLNYAKKKGYIDANPLNKVGCFKDVDYSSKKEMNYYTSDEFKLFIETARKQAEEEQAKYGALSEWGYYVFFAIAFYTGLRKGEIHALKWSDLKDGYLTVSKSITQKLKGEDRVTPPKNKSSFRTLQMPLPLNKILDEHKARQESVGRFTEDRLICGWDRSLRDSTLKRRNEKYAELAGLKFIRIHDYRHSHVSLLANAGINIQEVARRLGHARVEETWNTYCHLYPREEEKAVAVLNEVD